MIKTSTGTIQDRSQKIGRGTVLTIQFLGESYITNTQKLSVTRYWSRIKIC